MERLYFEIPGSGREEDAFDYIREFHEYQSEINGTGGLDRFPGNYAGWLEKLEQDYTRKPSEEKVPARTFFLVRESDRRIVGMINIRLCLNERLRRFGGHIGYSIRPTERGKGYNKINLYLALKVCNEHGIEKVFMDADLNNPASWKTMEALGGVRIREYEDDVYAHCTVADYEIDVRKALEDHPEYDQADVPGAGQGLTDRETVRKQYGTADRLSTRISLHKKYSTNRQGFGNWITSHYQIREGMSVLELGCGTGEMWTGSEAIIRRCSRFVLSDLSEGMLDKAKATLGGGGIEYRVIDIQDIPFGDQAFDVVIANMMLYHVPDLSQGLRQVRRVLKEDGTFWCATYGENGMMAYICSLFREYQIQNQENRSFTLQNGEEKLRPFFSRVQRYLYEDALEVTDAEDMADYIFSLAGMTELRRISREEVRSVLERNMRSGVLTVPKEYGLFEAKK